ncbi:hypothetical protein E2320_006726 [Naja naja]|nr:hypothetical protein E2320_006726 [Naja naja]
MSDPEDEDGETCWNNLESFRVKLISVIDPSRITPYLRQCRVINHDDEEQVLNDPSLRTGKKGFVAFLESLELYYPHLYKKITGNDPTRVFSMIIDTAGESGLMEVLMSEVSKLQAAVREERQKVQELNVTLSTKEDTIKEMRVRDSVLRKYQERAHKVKEERDSLSKELMLCREENYKLAMNYARQSEEKNVALMKNRDLQLEALEAEWRRVLKEQQELVNTACDLRQALQRAEEGRDKLVGEKELLELRCTSLQNDNKIYQNRIKAILKQLEEVAAERDQALLTQEECHKQYSQGLREKDSYRKQIREFGERCDELQLQLFQKEGRLLRRSPVDGDLPEKGHRRMKDSFEHYRRKRALRRVQESRYHEAYWEHSSGSDNTDTEDA